MKTTALLQILMVIGGSIFLAATFVEYVKRRMTEEIGLLWIFFSVLIIVMGIIPGSLAWAGQMGRSTVLVLFGFVFFLLLLLFYLSIVISQLLQKNQELAIQVSLLSQENEQILTRLKMISEENI